MFPSRDRIIPWHVQQGYESDYFAFRIEKSQKPAIFV